MAASWGKKREKARKREQKKRNIPQLLEWQWLTWHGWMELALRNILKEYEKQFALFGINQWLSKLGSRDTAGPSCRCNKEQNLARHKQKVRLDQFCSFNCFEECTTQTWQRRRGRAESGNRSLRSPGALVDGWTGKRRLWEAVRGFPNWQSYTGGSDYRHTYLC